MAKDFSSCTMGVGCDEARKCFAEAQGKPNMCALPCCMWCGAEKAEAGWHFYCFPQALCSEKCSSAFKAAI